MTREDKGRLLAFIYAVVAVGITAVFYMYTKYINPTYLILFVMLFQQSYILPNVCRNYSIINDTPFKWHRFAPLWNEYTIFPTFLAKLTLWMGLVCFGLAVFGFMPAVGLSFVTTIMTSLFGDSVGMNFSFYCILFSALIYVVLNVIRGLGFLEVKRVTDRIYRRSFGKVPAGAFNKSQYLMMFIPVLRTIALGSLMERLRKMAEFNSLDDDRDLFEEKGRSEVL